jgi:hypothetical protein
LEVGAVLSDSGVIRELSIFHFFLRLFIRLFTFAGEFSVVWGFWTPLTPSD